MTVRHLLIFLAIALSSTACLPWSNKAVRFSHAQHDQPLSGAHLETAYQLSLEREQTALSNGTLLRSDVLSLIHPETQEKFVVSTGLLFDDTSAGLSCRNCITVLNVRDKTYLITRFNGGGSGGFYFHDIAELTETAVSPLESSISCGQVLQEEQQIVFPSYEFKCPEMLFSPNSGSEQTEVFVFP